MNVRSLQFATVLVVVCFVSVQGLTCWTCDNADSIEECDQKGRLETCNPSQNVCGIEVRHQGSWAFPDRVKVFKYCKQANACDNIMNQNGRAAYKETQCNPKWPYSVCRCCCVGDACNAGELKCLNVEPPADCPSTLRAPANGRMRCSDGTKVGSVCSFQCDRGFFMVGGPTSTCQKDNTWSANSPACRREAVLCPALAELKNGVYDCNNDRNVGSVCSFYCNEGYKLIGATVTVCEEDINVFAVGRWSTRGQRCERKSCSEDLEAPANGEITCTDGRFVNSVCSFVCDEGYERFGPQRITCRDGYMYGKPDWDDEVPMCRRMACRSFPQIPANGFMACSDGKSINSVCEFTCDNEYSVIGKPRTTCMQQANGAIRWNYDTPKCERRQCPSTPEAPENGHVICDYDNFITSVCTFACTYGYQLVGNDKATCVDDKGPAGAVWEGETPVCQRKECDSSPAAPINGDVVCSRMNYLGSVCEFTCDTGYNQVGYRYTTCVENYESGFLGWDNEAPQCKRKECTTGLRAPTNGAINCADMKFLGSTCEFTCNEGYQMFGSDRSTCVENAMSGVIGWDNRAPECLSNACARIMEAPENGDVICTNGNAIGSVCTFACSDDFDIVGSGETECVLQKDFYKPMWTNNPPMCQRQECDTLPETPDNAYKTCTDYRSVNSICTFSCEKGYAMTGPETTQCVKTASGPAWDSELPTCSKQACPAAVVTPDNGKVTCSDANMIGSVCLFTCDKGFDMAGPEQTVCMIGYESKMPAWDNESPRCIRKECSYAPKAPMHGSIDCTDKQFYGSVCTFACMDDYMLVGAAETECRYLGDQMTTRPQWTNMSPTCIRRQCDVIKSPASGHALCDRKNFAGSKCEFVCNDNHRLIGPTDAVCQDINGVMEWSNTIMPVCEALTCSPIADIPFGAVACSDEHNVNSECKFTCTGKDYKLSPRRRYSITCQNDTNWSAAPPCCARSCPPYAIMDLIVVLDSSSSIGPANWKVMINFVKNIFNLFIVTPEAMNFGVIRYNKKIDIETQINLNDCPDNVTMLTEEVSKIPYDGSGTHTGQAITYVRENMLLPEVGNRQGVQDVVLVITDGRSQDDVTEPSFALRSDGVLTFALGITPKGKSLDMDQLRDIAGSESALFLAEDGFDNLTPEFAEEIMQNICGDPCPSAAQ